MALNDCLIAFGANLGETSQTLGLALRSLESTEVVVAVSQTMQTPAVSDRPGQPEYTNAAIRIRSRKNPFELIERLLEIEEQLGRRRGELQTSGSSTESKNTGEKRWTSRTVDLDIVLFGDQMIHSQNLTVPHPRMSLRRFVLEPASGIAGDMIDPVSGLTIDDLLTHINRVQKIVLLAFEPGWPQKHFFYFFDQQAIKKGWVIQENSRVRKICQKDGRFVASLFYVSEVSELQSFGSKASLAVFDRRSNHRFEEVDPARAFHSTYAGPALRLNTEPLNLLEEYDLDEKYSEELKNDISRRFGIDDLLAAIDAIQPIGN